MLTYRCAHSAWLELRARDPNSAISESFIRDLLNRGEIPYVKRGAKKIFAMEHLLDYLNNCLSGAM